MHRVALVITFVGAMAACVPPDQTWSSRSTSQGQPYQRSPDQTEADDREPGQSQLDESEPDHSRLYQSKPAQTRPDHPDESAPDESQPRSTRLRSHSDDNCAPVCERFEQCRLWKHDSCMSYCRSHTVDPAKNLTAAQWSCPKLGTWMQHLGVSGSSSGSGPWHCRAVGTYAPASTTSAGPDYGNKQNIDLIKAGPTRDAASNAAIDECNNVLSIDTDAWVYPGSLVLEYCRVISCSR